MKLNYNLDITEDSSSLIHTPSLISQQLPFFVHNCGHFYANRGYYTEREEQDNYLLIYTISGTGSLKYREKECILKPGHVFFINCNEYQYYRTGEEGDWEIKWVHFNGSACKFFFDNINEDSLNIITLPDTSEFERHFNEIPATILKNDFHTDIKLSMLLTNILTELSINKHNPAGNKILTQHSAMLERAIDYIQAHYTENIGIKDIIKPAHTSEFYFMRLFRKYTGVSAYEYLTNFRVNKSKLLLKETGLTVCEISGMVGFNNVNNYIRDFKKVVGTTPLNYRNYWIT